MTASSARFRTSSLALRGVRARSGGRGWFGVPPRGRMPSPLGGMESATSCRFGLLIARAGRSLRDAGVHRGSPHIQGVSDDEFEAFDRRRARQPTHGHCGAVGAQAATASQSPPGNLVVAGEVSRAKGALPSGASRINITERQGVVPGADVKLIWYPGLAEATEGPGHHPGRCHDGSLRRQRQVPTRRDAERPDARRSQPQRRL